MRYGSTFVPNSSDGRAILLALLRCSLKDEDAMTDAPWLDRAELPKLRRKARRINWYDIGTVVKCSYDERKAGRFHILRPYDVTWEEVQRRQKENRLLKERERSRRNRLKRWEEREMMRNEVSRESAVMRLLTAVWMPVAELVEKIEKNRQQAFQYRLSDGKPLKPNGLRKLVHVALRKLEELGQIEIEMVEGPRGPVGMARKIDLHSDLENDPENLPAAYDFLHREA
jgi:hypothetical protein